MVVPTNFTKFSTVGYVLGIAMLELGLSVPTTFIGGADKMAQQLAGMLTTSGQDLCYMHDWQFLHKEWAQPLVIGQSVYALPEDWNDFVDDTLWNNSSRLPLIGPVTPQVWRMLKARLAGGTTISIQYRVVGNKLVLYNAPESEDELQADYYGRGWVQDTTDITVYRDNVQQDSDMILLDTRLVVPYLKLKWRAAKGFDTVASVEEFNQAFELVTGRDSPGLTLSIGQRSLFPCLGYANIPDSGYGVS